MAEQHIITSEEAAKALDKLSYANEGILAYSLLLQGGTASLNEHQLSAVGIEELSLNIKKSYQLLQVFLEKLIAKEALQ